MKMNNSHKLIAGIILTCLFACSGEKKNVEKSEGKEIKIVEKVVEKKWETFNVGAVGNTMSEMKYDVESITVKEGSWIRINLENQGIDNSMMHNIVFINYGTRKMVASEAIKIWPSQNFVVNKKNIIAYSGVAKPGESVVLEFKAPKKGNYEYLCTYPGHAEIMRGYFFVK
jgi:azurin